MTHRPLVLTGGPAAGKSTTALALATGTPRTAFIDVDDIRQLIKNGGAAPWDGQEGIRQQLLGVRNAAALAQNFLDQDISVTIADVVNEDTVDLYRRLLPEVLVLQLALRFEEAQRRARLRKVYLTEDEFRSLHDQQAQLRGVDLVIDVTGLALADQVEAVRRAWLA